MGLSLSDPELLALACIRAVLALCPISMRQGILWYLRNNGEIKFFVSVIVIVLYGVIKSCDT